VSDLSHKSDDQLMTEAGAGQEGYQRVSVEVARRLRISLDALRRSNDWYSKWMMGLTIAVAILTLVLTVLTALLVYQELLGLAGRRFPPPWALALRRN
jgi:hypothetical protein